MGEFTYRPTERRDLEAVNRILADAFTPGDEIEAINEWTSSAGIELMRTAELDGRVVGTARLIELGQFFGQRRVPMAGVAGVAIAPQARAGGVGHRLMRACIEEMSDRGAPISTLYASASAFYRKLGYETAGTLFTTRIPTDLIPKRHAKLTVRPFEESDLDNVNDCYERVARPRDGALARNGYIWNRVRKPKQKPARGFVFQAPDGSIEGYIFHRQRRKPDAEFPMELRVTDLGATTPEAVDTLLAYLRGFASMCSHIEFDGGPTHPIALALTQQRTEVSMVEHWMLRVLDVAEALIARGYPLAEETSITFTLDDTLLPKNMDTWTLTVRDGRGRVEAGGEPTMRLDANALASLYTGFASARDLRAWAGLACEDEATLDTCDRLFRGPTPCMTDMF